MNKTESVIHKGVSRPAMSAALIALSFVWFASARVWYATGPIQGSWSAIPQTWLLVLLIAPAVCFSLVLILTDARHRPQYSRLDRWALAITFVPVTLGTVLAVWTAKTLFFS